MSDFPQKYANLADDAYKDIDIDKYVKNKEDYQVQLGKYKILEHYSDEKTDYQGTIYQDINTGEIFVAHRGTASMEDGVVDYLMATQDVNLQIPHALALTERALKMAQDYAEDNNVPVPQVSITGHSLGGALAEVCAYEYGLKAMTFNGYGSVGLKYQNLQGEYKTVPREYHGDITNHMMANDVVNIANHHLGKEILYAREDELTLLKTLKYGDKDVDNNEMWLGVAAFTYGGVHSMSNFINDLNDNKHLSILNDPLAANLTGENLTLVNEFRRDIQINRESVLDEIRTGEKELIVYFSENGEQIKGKLPENWQNYLEDKIDQHQDKIDKVQYLFSETENFKKQFEEAKQQELGQSQSSNNENQINLSANRPDISIENNANGNPVMLIAGKSYAMDFCKVGCFDHYANSTNDLLGKFNEDDGLKVFCRDKGKLEEVGVIEDFSKQNLVALEETARTQSLSQSRSQEQGQGREIS